MSVDVLAPLIVIAVLTSRTTMVRTAMTISGANTSTGPVSGGERYARPSSRATRAA